MGLGLLTRRHYIELYKLQSLTINYIRCPASVHTFHGTMASFPQHNGRELVNVKGI